MSKIFLNEFSNQQENIENTIDDLITLSTKKVHLCPFRISKGFIKLTNTGEKPINVRDKDFSTVYNLKTSNEPVIVYWDKTFNYVFKGSANYISKVYNQRPNEQEQSTPQQRFIPYFFEAWVEHYNINTSTQSITINNKDHTTIKANTNISLIVKKPSLKSFQQYIDNKEQIKEFIIPFKQWETDLLKEYLFVIPDEHSQANQWLMISEYTPIYSEINKEYQGARITLTNINELLTTSGRDILSFIQPNQPGDGYLWPLIDNHGRLTYDIRRAKALGVKSIQLQTNGPFLLNSILINGRTFNNNGLELSGSKKLLLYEAKPFITSKFANLPPPTPHYYMLYNCKYELDKIYKDIYEKQRDFTSDYEAKITINGGLEINSNYQTSNPLSNDSDIYKFKLWDEGFVFNQQAQYQRANDQTDNNINWTNDTKSFLKNAGSLFSNVLFNDSQVALQAGIFTPYTGYGSFRINQIKNQLNSFNFELWQNSKGIIIPYNANVWDYLNHNGFMNDLINYLPYTYKESIRQNIGETLSDNFFTGIINKITDTIAPGVGKLRDATGNTIKTTWVQTGGFNFLAPCSTIDLLRYTKKEADLYNLDFFTDTETNTNNIKAPSISNCYHFDITDKFIKFINNTPYVFDTENIGQTHYRDGTLIFSDGRVLYWDSTCIAAPPNTPTTHQQAIPPANILREEDKQNYNFIIDNINIKGIGKCDFYLSTFYAKSQARNLTIFEEFNSNYFCVFESNCKYANDMTQWNNKIDFNCFDNWNTQGQKLDYPTPPHERDIETFKNDNQQQNEWQLAINEKLYKIGSKNWNTYYGISEPTIGVYDRTPTPPNDYHGAYKSSILKQIKGGTSAKHIANNISKVSGAYKIEVDYDFRNIYSTQATKTNHLNTLFLELSVIDYLATPQQFRDKSTGIFKGTIYEFLSENQQGFSDWENNIILNKANQKTQEVSKNILLRIDNVKEFIKGTNKKSELRVELNTTINLPMNFIRIDYDYERKQNLSNFSQATITATLVGDIVIKRIAPYQISIEYEVFLNLAPLTTTDPQAVLAPTAINEELDWQLITTRDERIEGHNIFLYSLNQLRKNTQQTTKVCSEIILKNIILTE